MIKGIRETWRSFLAVGAFARMVRARGVDFQLAHELIDFDYRSMIRSFHIALAGKYSYL